jgi:mxaJ protein
MSSVSRLLILFAAAIGVSGFVRASTVRHKPDTSALRVCADPNNLPFSNRRGEGFENKIAELVARDLRRPLAYYWLPQRRGFIRNSLSAGQCDVIMGMPLGMDAVGTTRPYYRSTYVFVSRRDRGLHVQSFDDPRLGQLVIGVQVTGDDYDNPPAAQALAARHLTQNVRGYTIYGNYSRPNPPRGLIDAVASGAVDVAVAWGPLAGYFAGREAIPLDLAPVSPETDGRLVRFVFDISMGVRRDDPALGGALDTEIARRGGAMTRILRQYGVPLVGATP